MPTLATERDLRSSVIVHSPETHLSVHNGCLAVESPQMPRVTIPPEHLGEVLVYGGWTLTSPVLALAARHRVPVAFFTLGGEWIGRLETAGEDHDGDGADGRAVSFDTLHTQWQLAPAEETALPFARRFVRAKLRSQRGLLASFRHRVASGEDRAVIVAATTALRLATVAATHAETLEKLRGIEGAAARHYNTALARCIAPEVRAAFPFERRTRRPPLDPFNAILSYLYTLLYHDCMTALLHLGLETRLGFLHAVATGRHSLACDLMEELRPLLADRLALSLVNRRQLRTEHFHTDISTGAVLLNAEGRRLLFAARAQRQRETFCPNDGAQPIRWMDLPLRQARSLAAAIRHRDASRYLACNPKL